jgi:hypothetical protein
MVNRGGDQRAARRGNETQSVVGVGGGEGRMFVLRDEELVEESDYKSSQECSAEKSRKRLLEDDSVSDASPTPGRENWKLRECKNMTGDGGGGAEERRGMSMTDIWPKDWGGKYFVFPSCRLSFVLK